MIKTFHRILIPLNGVVEFSKMITTDTAYIATASEIDGQVPIYFKPDNNEQLVFLTIAYGPIRDIKTDCLLFPLNSGLDYYLKNQNDELS